MSETATMPILETIGKSMTKVDVPDQVPSFSDFEKQAAEAYLDMLGFKKIDLGFLTMRDDQGYPKFTIFTPYNACCYLACETESYGTTKESSFPNKFRKHFRDVFKALKKKSKAKYKKKERGVKVSIYQNFGGVIPEDIKNKIERLRLYGVINEWALIAESDVWNTKTSKPTDPLVIGWRKGKGDVYLLDHFDQTNLEEMVRREFTS